MSIRDGDNRKVSFDTKEVLGDRLDKLSVMIGNLATRDCRTGSQFKPQIYQNRGRGQNRNYSQRNYQNRYRSNNRSNSGDRGQYRQDRGRPRYEQNYRCCYKGNMRSYGRQNSRREYRNSYRNDSYDRRWGTGLDNSHLSEIMAIIELEVKVTVDPCQDPEQVQIGIEFNVISVGNTIISQGTVPLLAKKKA